MRQTFDENADPGFGHRHLPLIRRELKRQGLDGFVIPHEDEHQNEYLPPANERLAWATGFTGSAGAAVVLEDSAAVFVDGRYTVQVAAQVDKGLFETLDLVDGGVPLFLEERTKPGQVIGYDPRLHSPDSLGWLKLAVGRSGAALKATELNPVDAAWGDVRPPQPMALAVPHPIAYSGEESASKRAKIGAALAKGGADAAVITSAASIAWLFNIRGGDVARTPLALAQAIVAADGAAELFLDPAKVSVDLPAFLGNQVRLSRPDDLEGALKALNGKRVMVDPSQSSAFYFETLTGFGAEVVRAEDPCLLPRACKNAVEVEGARKAHIRDGAALTRFLHWVALEAPATRPDEMELVTRLEAFRDATGALKDLSFDTIAGAGPNAALPHYRPVRASNRKVAPGELLLVDSGGQYLDGTTDVTRTMAIGAVDEEKRQRFTLVLKGHIALARVRFPAGTTGSALDALARQALWEHGFDYDHGTGHGVGSYLGVHEGPQRIAKAPSAVALRAGMIVSNEPGYYKVGAYGIRIENLQVVVEASIPEGGERPMLGFESLTMAPIDRTLIIPSLLSDAERLWLDDYHRTVVERVGPEVEPDVRAWLEDACAPL
jgi:Xaa-Pro aminopeptidase